MPRTKKPDRAAPRLTDDETQALITRLDSLIVNFEGDFHELESAIGMYMVGRIVGWKVLLLLHNKRTIKKYETILGGINIRDEFEPTTDFSNKSIAFKIITNLGNYWKGVNGEYSDPELKERRRELAL